MFASAIVLALVSCSGPSLTAVYSCHEEVRWLGEQDGVLLAGTGGGLLKLAEKGWVEVEPRVPCTVVRYDEGSVTTPTGAVMRQLGDEWRVVGRTSILGTGDTVSCETPLGKVETSLGNHELQLEGATARPAPPAEKVYALRWHEGRLWAGTSDGLWTESSQGWKRERLPSNLPAQRLHGLAIQSKKWLVGGPDGLWDGLPGEWRMIDPRPVRQIVSFAEVQWVLFGDGSVDKLDLAADKRYDSVLHGAVKRPWSSTLAAGDTLLFGGMGGWAEKSSEKTSETRPKELGGEVVTSLLTSRGATYLDTQAAGVFRFSDGRTTNTSLLEGLRDTWVTSLAEVSGSVLVGTSNGGLSRLAGNRAEPVATPSQSINHMVVWRGRLVIGGIEGAWISDQGEWKRLGPEATETTGLAPAGGDLFVLTPYGAYHYD